MSGRLLIGLAMCLVALATPARGATAATAAPTTRPTPKPAARPHLDFSGTWELDLATSKNVLPTLEKGLTMTVKQTGDRIWMEAQGPGAPKASDVLVADGRPYKKDLGQAGSATVTARWSPDGKALLMEVVAGDPKAPRAVQRSRWTLSPDKKTWWRHTITIDGEERRETGLTFRRRSAGAKPAPSPRRTPKVSPAPTASPG